MVRRDIFGSLKNAIARGYPMNAAKQSLINAGYPAPEVEAAAKLLDSKKILPVTTEPVGSSAYPKLKSKGGKRKERILW